MQSLAVKYRPKEFNEVCSQNYIIKILEKMVELNQFSNTILFAGPTGTGKTTLAKIFANKINKGKGYPIEIDAASNNGVDNVRTIIESSKERSLDSDYKVFIIDEVHMITTAGWNAFLKCLEEVPFYTIFIFCTTNPEKIPSTILNRVMRFNLTKIPDIVIKDRLKYICSQEGVDYTEEGIEHISKLADGGMRDAILNLETCIKYKPNINIENVLGCLGDFSYNKFFDLTNAIVDNNAKEIFTTVDNLYNEGKDLKLFINQYLSFTLDLCKYCLFKDINITKIPSYLEQIEGSPRCVKYVTGIENSEKYFKWLISKILEIKNIIKYDDNIKTTIQVMLINCAEGK